MRPSIRGPGTQSIAVSDIVTVAAYRQDPVLVIFIRCNSDRKASNLREASFDDRHDPCAGCPRDPHGEDFFFCVCVCVGLQLENTTIM